MRKRSDSQTFLHCRHAAASNIIGSISRSPNLATSGLSGPKSKRFVPVSLMMMTCAAVFFGKCDENVICACVCEEDCIMFDVIYHAELLLPTLYIECQ